MFRIVKFPTTILALTFITAPLVKAQLEAASDITAYLELSPSDPSVTWPDEETSNQLAPNYTATLEVTVVEEEEIDCITYALSGDPTVTPLSSDPDAVWTESGSVYSITNTAKDLADASLSLTCTWSPQGGGSGGNGQGSADISGSLDAEIKLLDSAVEWSFQRTRQWAEDGKEISFGITMTDDNGHGLERWTLDSFTATEATPQDPGWQIIPMAMPPGGSSWLRMANASSDIPSKGKISLVYNDGSEEERVSEDEIAFIEIKLNTVGFVGQGNLEIKSDDDALVGYPKPHWNDPDGDGDFADGHSHPVAYKSDTKLTLSPVWTLNPNVDGVQITVRASGTDSISIEPQVTRIDDGKVDLQNPAEANPKFVANKVRYWEEFEMKFEASFTTENEWVDVGTSNNQLYVTRRAPTAPALFHTVIHLGCSNADGLTTESQIVNSVWSLFKNLDVSRVDGSKLHYYENYNCLGGFTSTLLQTKDGQCRTWVLFLMDCLKVHGIQRNNNLVSFDMPLEDEGLIVDRWHFEGSGTSGKSHHPYYGIKDSPFISNTSYDWSWTEVSDLDGIEGQNTDNPASYFGNHELLFIDGTYYDPSYGKTYSSKDNFHTSSLAGFWRESTKIVYESETFDINGDGDREDLFLKSVILFKKPSLPTPLIETRSTH